MESRSIDSDVAVYNNDSAVGSLQHILVMHIAEINVGSGIRPIAWVAQLESHTLHIVPYLPVFHMLSFYKWLFYHNLEIAFFGTSEAQYRKASLWEIGIVERDAVKCQNRLNKIVKTYRFDQSCPVVVNFSLTALGNLLTERTGKGFVDTICPAPHSACPLFYAFSLLRSAFELSFEVVAIRCNSAI